MLGAIDTHASPELHPAELDWPYGAHSPAQEADGLSSIHGLDNALRHEKHCFIVLARRAGSCELTRRPGLRRRGHEAQSAVSQRRHRLVTGYQIANASSFVWL